MAEPKNNAAGKKPRTRKRAAEKAAAPSETPPEIVAPAAEKRAGRKRLWWLWLIPLALLAGGAWLGYQYLAEVPERIGQLEARVAELAELERELEEIRRKRTEDAALLNADAQEARLAVARVREALEVRLSALERGLETIGGPLAAQQTVWKLDAADGLLALADRQNRFARDYAGAALALREALILLEELGDPRYGALRAELEEQARALERLPDRDIEGVVVRISALISRIERLAPATRPDSPATAAEAELPPQGWERALASIRRALRSLITVRRADSGSGALLTDTDTETLRRLLAAELHLARLAYIQNDLQAYSAALVAARARVARLYAASDPDAADTVADIDQLLQRGQARETPDIAASLRRMRALRSD